jgi:hypothetical protein
MWVRGEADLFACTILRENVVGAPTGEDIDLARKQRQHAKSGSDERDEFNPQSVDREHCFGPCPSGLPKAGFLPVEIGDASKTTRLPPQKGTKSVLERGTKRSYWRTMGACQKQTGPTRQAD